MRRLTLEFLKQATAAFVRAFGARPIADLYGVTDGKAVGTYVEQAFHAHLRRRYEYAEGNAARGSISRV